MNVIDCVEEVWIDGIKYVIRLVGDLETGLAEDACLVEYEDDEPVEQNDFHVGDEYSPDDTLLVTKLHDEWVKEDDEVKPVQVDGVVGGKDSYVSLNIQAQAEKNIDVKLENMVGSLGEAKKEVRCKRRKELASLLDLKMVARLSDLDRKELLKALKSAKKRKGF